MIDLIQISTQQVQSKHYQLDLGILKRKQNQRK